LFEGRLAEQNILSEEAAQAIHAEITEQVKAGIEFAESSPFPEPDALLEDVYA
jgi:pyruvate dehydrogenase E1 component alpha subunit